jgi:phage protein D
MLPYVLQHNQTDLEFLAVRARRINFEVVVTDRDLSSGRARSPTRPN